MEQLQQLQKQQLATVVAEIVDKLIAGDSLEVDEALMLLHKEVAEAVSDELWAFARTQRYFM
jgi:Flp pilus assembly protein TadB